MKRLFHTAIILSGALLLAEFIPFDNFRSHVLYGNEALELRARCERGDCPPIYTRLPTLLPRLRAADITKVVQTELQAIANVSSGAQDLSSEFATGKKLAAYIFFDFSPEATNTNQTELRVEINETVAGDNDKWREFWSTITTASAVNTHAIDGTEAVGQTVIEESVTTGLTDGDGQIVFIKDGTTITDSEWVKLVAVSASTSFTIQDGLRVQKDTGDDWYNQAEHFAVSMDLAAKVRLRAVCNNNNGGGSVAVNWRVALITADSIE